MAFEDGSDIITASIGSMGGWSEEAWSVVASRIVDVSTPRSQPPGHVPREEIWMKEPTQTD